jgi:hypothetical protein
MDGILVIAAIALVAWFAAGTIWNVRRASALMRWMQDGLPLLGRRATVRWLGSSAVQLDIAEGAKPFARATVVLFLEPRDLPWWPLSRARGRRDTLILRGTLRVAPRVELEAIEPASWSGRDALARIPRGWLLRDAEAGQALAIHGADAEAVAHGEKLLALARDVGLDVRRLSVRGAEPHFQVHLAWPDAGSSARGLFECLARLALVSSEEHRRSP